MHSKSNRIKIPTEEQFAAARQMNRYNIALDGLDQRTASKIEAFCVEEKIAAQLEPDTNSLQYKISIFDVNFEVIEKLEIILADNQKAKND